MEAGYFATLMVPAGPEESASPEEGLIRIPATIALLLLVAVVRLPRIDVVMEYEALTGSLLLQESAAAALIGLLPVARPSRLLEVAGAGPA